MNLIATSQQRRAKHSKQIKAWRDPSRFKFLLAGRRGGKTTIILERLMKRASTMPKNSKIFYIGPTNQDAKDLIWDPLEDKLDELGWKYQALISQSKFKLPGKRQIMVIGAEKIRRVRGHPCWHYALDEIAYFSTPLNEVMRALRPGLADLKGTGDAATTPNGKGTEAYDFYLGAMDKHNWSTHIWRTLDNPYIDPDEIEEARKELDPKSFAQEYLATWETFEGLAYYTFDENVHIKKQPPITDELPVILQFDFNVNPTTLLIAQSHPAEAHKDYNMYRFKKEYSFKNSSTLDTMKNFCEEYKDKAPYWQVKIRGDASGRSRSSTTGWADYEYIHEMLDKYGFQYQHEVPASNPAIVDRVSHVNGYLKNVEGDHRVEFDPCMKETILDLSSQVLEGRFPSDKNNRGHKADAVGYGIYWDYINRARGEQKTIQL